MESNAKNVVTRESVLVALTKNGGALEYASKKLRADREIVLAEPQRSDSEHMEPVAAQHRFRHPQKIMPDWSVWQPCKVAQRPAWEIDSQGYEVEYRALYAAPQPVKRHRLQG